jgi:hypothetical protein
MGTAIINPASMSSRAEKTSEENNFWEKSIAYFPLIRQ